MLLSSFGEIGSESRYLFSLFILSNNKLVYLEIQLNRYVSVSENPKQLDSIKYVSHNKIIYICNILLTGQGLYVTRE